MTKCNTLFFACKNCAVTMCQSSGKQKHSSTRDTQKDSDTIITKLNSLETSSTEIGPLHIEALINKRFDKLDQSIEEIIEKKLAGRVPVTPITAEAGSNVATTYATISAESSPAPPATVEKDIVFALKRSRNSELIQEQERQKRENNIIIYGIGETLLSENIPLNIQDKEFISSFLETIEVDITTKQIIRLVNAVNTGRNRPVKVALKNADDKCKIM